MQTYTQNLAGALAGLGHSVSVICCNTNGQSAFEETSGIRVHRLPCKNYLNGRFPVPKKGAELEATLAEIAKRGVDFVVLNAKFYELTTIGAKFARDHGIAPILIEHGSAALTIGSPILDVAVQYAERHMTRRAMKYSPFCYGVSAKASAWLSHFGIQACGELYNSIDARLFARAGALCNRDFRQELQLNNDDILVCSIGRLVPEKGVLEVVEAAALLAVAQLVAGAESARDNRGTSNANGAGAESARGASNINAKIHFAIAGDGPLLSTLQQHVTSKNLSNVHILGRTTPAESSALLSQSQIYCLPSRSEGFATTLLEAAACATPAIVTNVGGCDELIRDENFGMIIPDAKAATIAKAIAEACAKPDVLKKQGENIRALVQKEFSWEKTALAVLSACEEHN